jgi:hypothetical protein
MRDLKIKETKITPKVEFNPANNTLTFEGKILCDNTPEFFEPIINWLQEYEMDAPDKTALNFSLEYLNTSSSKYLLNMLKRFEKLNQKGKKVEVNWYYEADDDNIEDAGKDFHLMVDVPFNFVPTHEA